MSSRRRPLAALALALAGVLATGGCASAADERDDRPLVLTTFTVLADIAQEVGGEHVRVESITSVGVEIHGYEPTPSDVARASGADLVIDNGLGLEAWFERFITDLDVPRVVASEGVETIAIADGDDGGAPNPHAWMSPTAVQSYATVIAEALAELEPEREAEFAANAEAYGGELQAIHDELVAAVATLPEPQRVLVTCEGAFSYLARDAGLDEAYIWPVNAERQATPRRIAAAIAVVEDRGVPTVFCESTVSDAAMLQVVEATGAELGGTLYVDSLSESDGPVPTYLDLIRHDVDVIVDGLGRGA